MELAEGGRNIVCLRLIYIYVDLSHTGAAYHGMADGNTLHLKKQMLPSAHICSTMNMYGKNQYMKEFHKKIVFFFHWAWPQSLF